MSWYLGASAAPTGLSQAVTIPPLREKDRARFWAKVQKRGEDECWIWTAAKTSGGYGSFYAGGRMLLAHRVAVRLAGYAVPTKAVIDHECRNRLCVNPGHLRTVDRFTNVHENSHALAHLNALKEGCPEGHPYSGDNLIVRSSGRRRCRECTNAAQRALRARKRETTNV